MESSTASSPPAVTEAVPINIAPSAEDAPPTLAEPASGPVATMSGALQGADAANAPAPSVESNDAVMNGSSDTATEPATADAQPNESTAVDLATDDAEMKDEDVPATSTEHTALDANGTPSTSKKGANGKRKSTGGVPEHKSKKLNKKKSMQKITHLDAQPGEYYFARLKSYPPWPSIVCDEEMLPQTLLSTRPVTTKQADGTYKEAYADGGKRAHERTFPVMFLQTNEFAWIPNTDLNTLDPEDVKDFSEKGKAKSLIGAYQVAAEGHPLQHFKEVLQAHQDAMQEDIELQEQRAAEKTAKADKKKRKSEVADEDVEMDDVEADEEITTKKSSKKRKKALESEGDEDKPAKTPKTSQKLKLTTPKAPATTEKKIKETAKAKPKSERKKAVKAVVSDEEMADEEVKEPAKPLDPAEEKKAREKEVLFLRHKLQKGFLSRDQAPQESEMSAMSNFIKKLEGYADLEVSIIRTTKINKVLKALIKLNTIPKDEEFNFRGRSVELLGQWNKLLGTDNAGDDDAGPSSAVEKKEKPTTNGHKEDDNELEAADKPAEAPAELAESTEAVNAAPDASEESKEEVADTLVTEAATDGGVEDTKKLGEEVQSTDDVEMSEPVKLDQAPASAEGAAEAAEITKSTE